MPASSAMLTPEQPSYEAGQQVVLIYTISAGVESVPFRGVARLGSSDLVLTGTVEISDRLLGTDPPTLTGYTFVEDAAVPGRWVGTPG